MNNELKPCPFCGCDKILTAEETWMDDYSVVVYCNDCGVSLPKSAWNNRPGEKQAVLEVVERIRRIITDAGSLDFPQINARDLIGIQYHDLLYRLNCIESEIKQEAGDD
jgi:hypothetical protein